MRSRGELQFPLQGCWFCPGTLGKSLPLGGCRCWVRRITPSPAVVLPPPVMLSNQHSLTLSHGFIISNIRFILQRTTLALSTSAQQFIILRQFLYYDTQTWSVLLFSSLVCSTLQMCAVYELSNRNQCVGRDRICLSKIRVGKCFQQSKWADLVFTFKSRHWSNALIKNKGMKLLYCLNYLNHFLKNQ